MKLRKEVAKIFIVDGTMSERHYFYPMTWVVDLKRISLSEAETLVNSGFPYLKRKKQSPKKPNNPL